MNRRWFLLLLRCHRDNLQESRLQWLVEKWRVQDLAVFAQLSLSSLWSGRGGRWNYFAGVRLTLHSLFHYDLWKTYWLDLLSLIFIFHYLVLPSYLLDITGDRFLYYGIHCGNRIARGRGQCVIKNGVTSKDSNFRWKLCQLSLDNWGIKGALLTYWRLMWKDQSMPFWRICWIHREGVPVLLIR